MQWHRRYQALFGGRTDRIGGDEGRSILLPTDDPNRIDRCYDEHLDNGDPIGIYPITPANDHVVWGCVDFDHGKPASEYKTSKEAQEAAALLQRVVIRVGLNCWHEISRSRGAHLWTFATEPVPAKTMRRALIVCHQIINMPYREINPKQETLNGKIGSYVRLPYPGRRQPGTQEVLWNGIILSAEDFTNMAFDARSLPAAYERVASMFKEQAPVEYKRAPSSNANTLAVKGLTRHILEHGPLPGSDRSGTLFKLALRCREDGLSPSDCHSLLLDADARWGKFQAANNVEQLDRIVQEVYR